MIQHVFDEFLNCLVRLFG